MRCDISGKTDEKLLEESTSRADSYSERWTTGRGVAGGGLLLTPLSPLGIHFFRMNKLYNLMSKKKGKKKKLALPLLVCRTHVSHLLSNGVSTLFTLPPLNGPAT